MSYPEGSGRKAKAVKISLSGGVLCATGEPQSQQGQFSGPGDEGRNLVTRLPAGPIV